MTCFITKTNFFSLDVLKLVKFAPLIVSVKNRWQLLYLRIYSHDCLQQSREKVDLWTWTCMVRHGTFTMLSSVVNFTFNLVNNNYFIITSQLNSKNLNDLFFIFRFLLFCTLPYYITLWTRFHILYSVSTIC